MNSLSTSMLQTPKNPLWFKITGFLQQNWGMVVDNSPNDACIYFFDDHGVVFDKLTYPSGAQADHALAFNGYTPLVDEPGFKAIAGEPRFPLTHSDRMSRPVYSSGEYWREPPDLERIKFRRILTPQGLERFIDAQSTVIEQALEELKNGEKSSHWMWFVFPQLSGLGRSSKSKKYGIVNIEEALEYLSHPILGKRLRLCFQLTLMHSEKSAKEIFGPIDSIKLRSCATLFNQVDKCADSEFARALKIFFGGKLDQRTLELL